MRLAKTIASGKRFKHIESGTSIVVRVTDGRRTRELDRKTGFVNLAFLPKKKRFRDMAASYTSMMDAIPKGVRVPDFEEQARVALSVVLDQTGGSTTDLNITA